MSTSGGADAVCLPVLVTQSIAFLKVWPPVFGLLEALLLHGFPFAVGTDMFTFFSKCILSCYLKEMPRLLDNKE